VGNTSYKQGEIDFFQYIQSLENAIDIQAEYLDNVLNLIKPNWIHNILISKKF
jgi:cobalt-zinc-cadmium resistance protein CzcA